MDKANEFISQRQMFRLRRTYRFFYHWMIRYKDSLFRKIISGFDEKDAIAGPRFRFISDRVRTCVSETMDNFAVLPPEFDMKTDDVDFEEYEINLVNAIKRLENLSLRLSAEVTHMLGQFFNEIRAVNVIMKLNFDELNALNALPQPIKEFSVDLKYRTHSLHNDRMRTLELEHQREIAEKRESYLRSYFTKVWGLYTGDLVLKSIGVELQFLSKFDSTKADQRRLHRIVARFDPIDGLQLTPTRDEFSLWISEKCQQLRRAFLQNPLPLEVIKEVFPDFSFEFSDPFEIADRFKDVPKTLEKAIKAGNDAFSFFEVELKSHAAFLNDFIRILAETEAVTNPRDVEQLVRTLEVLERVRTELAGRPRCIFHRVSRGTGDAQPDFVVDMRGCWETGSALLDDAMIGLRDRVMNELNNAIFPEIQEMWAQIKDKRVTRSECASMEARLLMFSILAVAVVKVWPEKTSDCRGGLDPIMRIYQALADKTSYTHRDCVNGFNESCDKFGLVLVLPQEEEDTQDDYEYEYEEINE
jgi:hypothetical protein